MSFGLLNELSALVDDPSRVPAIFVDHSLRNEVLAACLHVRKKSGKIEKPIDVDDVEISIDDVDHTLKWAGDHLTSFFVKALRQVVAVTEASKADMEVLESSLGSLKA